MSKKLFVIVLPLLFFGCKENAPPEPPPYVRSIELEALDVSCTEAWLKITLTESNQPHTITLKRDDTVTVFSALHVASSDTVLIDEGLLPNRTYTYTAYRLSGTSVSDSSQRVQVTTMDTTSHNFTWQIDTLGDGGSSVLYDVAIINDTLAYAVGEIFHADSSQNWTFFNLAKWDGREWTLQRVYYRQNNIIHTRWILAFAWNDIWITPYTHWDGTAWREVPFDPIFSGVRTNKAWGTSSRDFYVVGDGGFIAHYDGTSWRRIESGTTLPINDVWGDYNAEKLEYEILCIASDISHNIGKRLLRIGQQYVTTQADSGLSWSLATVWFIPNRKYCVGGDGFYMQRTIGPVWSRNTSLPPYYKAAVRGNNLNNIIVVGAFGLILSFNGMSWYNHQAVTYLPDGSFGRVAMLGKLVIAVGGTSTQAIVAIGKK